MVKLTLEMIFKQIPGLNKRRSDLSIEQCLGRLTHLPVQHRMIDGIDSIPPCRALTVIYLYENLLTQIENLNFAENLTHLYLQNNRLQKLENLDQCRKLQKLYLAGNQIQVLEGLEHCPELVEISIENQRLAEGEKLLFDPRTIRALSTVLEVLNVSGNHLDTLIELGDLQNLRELSASNNRLENFTELVQLVSEWRYLKRLETSRNPFCVAKRYRERLIVVGSCLESLDGKSISENARKFLLSWKASQTRRGQSKSDIVSSDVSESLPPSGISFFLPHLRSNVTRTHSMIFPQRTTTARTDQRRNLIKADLTLMRKDPISLAFVENPSRPQTRRHLPVDASFAFLLTPSNHFQRTVTPRNHFFK